MTEEEARHWLRVEKKTLSISVLQKAHRIALLKHHPDKGGSNQDFVLVAEAFEILKTIVANHSDYIPRRDFNDPYVNEWRKKMEDSARNGDVSDQKIIHLWRVTPGVGWPPIEDPDGATPGIREAGVEKGVPKQKNQKHIREKQKLKSHNNPGMNTNAVTGKRKRRVKQPREDQEERDKLPRTPKTNVCPVCQKLKGPGRPTKEQWYCPDHCPECDQTHNKQ